MTSLFAARRFRKKPVEIEAVQWDGQNRHEIVTFVGEALDAAWSVGGYCFINTLEGRMNAAVGDWIIKGVKGEFYPCKPDVFEQTYEPVDLPTHEWDDVRWQQQDGEYEAACGCGWTDTAWDYSAAEESLRLHLATNVVVVE